MENQEFDPKSLLDNAANDIENRENELSRIVDHAIDMCSATDYYIIAVARPAVEGGKLDRSFIQYKSVTSQNFSAVVTKLILEDISDRNLLIHLLKVIRERIKQCP